MAKSTNIPLLQNIASGLLVAFIIAICLLFPKQIFAACPEGYTCLGGCEAVGDCATSGKTCVLEVAGLEHFTIRDNGPACGGGKGQAALGGISLPTTSTKVWFPTGHIRIIDFLSLLLRIFTIISGLWFMFNIIVGGYLFITSSTDSGTMAKFKESLYFSLIGLFVIATAYLIAALVGSIFFGDAGFIIRPTLYSATDL